MFIVQSDRYVIETWSDSFPSISSLFSVFISFLSNTAGSMSLKDEFSIPDRYKVISQIGKGAYGIVAKGYDLKTKRYVFAFSTQVRQDVLIRMCIYRLLSRRKVTFSCLWLMPEECTEKCIWWRRWTTHAFWSSTTSQLQTRAASTRCTSNSLRSISRYLYEELMDTDLSSYISNKKHLSHEVIKEITYAFSWPSIAVGTRWFADSTICTIDMSSTEIWSPPTFLSATMYSIFFFSYLHKDLSVKICDFGLSRIVADEDIYRCIQCDTPSLHRHSGWIRRETLYAPNPRIHSLAGLPKLTRQLTQHVVTRWYRAPEIICMNKYGAKIDVWSLGCLFAELLMALKPTSTGSHEFETKKGSLFNGRPCAPLSPTSKKYPGVCITALDGCA